VFWPFILLPIAVVGRCVFGSAFALRCYLVVVTAQAIPWVEMASNQKNRTSKEEKVV
jgi:hypothetical protein